MIEVAPGEIRSLGQVHDAERIRSLGDVVIGYFSDFITKYPDRIDSLRYHCFIRATKGPGEMGNLLSKSDKAFLRTLDDRVLARVSAGHSGFDIQAAGNGELTLLQQSAGVNRFGWHIDDKDTDEFRLLTNLSRTETEVYVTDPFIGASMLDFRNHEYQPDSFETIVIPSGESYVVNNLVYSYGANRKTPHATPDQERFMMSQHFVVDLGRDDYAVYEQGRGIPVFYG